MTCLGHSSGGKRVKVKSVYRYWDYGFCFFDAELHPAHTRGERIQHTSTLGTKRSAGNGGPSDETCP